MERMVRAERLQFRRARIGAMRGFWQTVEAALPTIEECELLEVPEATPMLRVVPAAHPDDRARRAAT